MQVSFYSLANMTQNKTVFTPIFSTVYAQLQLNNVILFSQYEYYKQDNL